MNATDLTRVKAWMAETGQGGDLDPQLNTLIPAVSRAIEGPSILNRSIERAARVEIRRLSLLRTSTILLSEGPVDTSAAFTVKLDDRADWTNALELVSGEDFVLQDTASIVNLRTPAIGPTFAQVTYTAGLAATLDALESAYPDVVQAASMWVAHIFRRRNQLEGEAISQPGGGGVTYTAALAHPPEAVKGLLMPYRWGVPGGR